MKGNLGIFNIRGFALVTSAVLTISVLSACSGGGGATAPQNLPPVGSLDAVDLSPQHIVGPAPRTVQFTATYSDPENRLSSAILDFGDGESTTLTAPNSVVSHSYRQEGFYQPRLLLSDDVPGRTVTIYVNNDSSFRIMVTAPLPPPALTVVIEGRGRVDSEPDYPGISCPSDCNEDYSQGSMVTLIVTPENGWRFDGWGKDCGGPLTALPVRIQGIKTCVAHFSQIYYTLRVTTEGAGRVNSDAPGINCPGDCSESYPALTPVGLTATPDPGWVFEGWTGACTGPNATTQVAITSDKTCTARFTQTHQLNVAVTGQGSVSSNPVGINCPGDCSEVYLTLTVVTLTATPAPGWGFLNWSGDCSGSLPTFGITVNALKNCTAIFAPVYPLNVSVIGSGTVQSNPTGINCPPDCSEPYFVNTSVSLSARPVPGWGFAGWSGDCSGTHPTTQVTLDSARNCTATFKILRTLSVITNGQGSVSSNPAGVSCPSDCSEPYLTDSLITLTATPADGWTFANWTGDCSGSDPSTSVNLNTDKTCAANFVQLWYDLSLTVNGQGSVSSNPAGINCPAGNCTASFPSYTLVTLTATAFPGWVFAGWSGACSGTSPSLQVTLNTPKACTATFSQTPPLTVTLNGQGSVSSNPAGINCPADCSENYLIGSTVTLTATPANGWAFANWSGDCSGSNSSIQVFMDAGKACTANFTQLQYNFNLTVTGQGSVTSNPAGINCPGDCTETYPSNTLLTLTATPANGWQFSQWTGDCSGGTPTLQIPLSTPKTCGAIFTQLSYIISAATVGNGTVTSNPPGINCPGDCSEPFLSNTVITLTATPGPNFMFVSWSGDCTGTNPTTQVTANADKLCTANFTDLQYTLTVAVNGQGTVTDVPPIAINCPGDCSELYLANTVVTLTATPAAGWSFVNWSGACSGTNPTIQVTMNADKTCTANFSVNVYTLTVSITGTGTVTSNPPGIACPGDCTENYTGGTVVTLTASSSPPWNFSAWSGNCSGTNPVTQVTMTANRSCTATFTSGPLVIYSQNFEANDGGWTHGIYPGGPSGVVDTWHRANQTCNGISLGTYAYGANGNFGPSCVTNSARERSYALSPVITMPPTGSATLTFTAWAADELGSCLIGSGWDRKDVGITTDGGNTYTRLNQCTALVTAQNVWQNRTFSLGTTWAGQNIQIMFVYDTIDNVVGHSFYIDNVQITSP